MKLSIVIVNYNVKHFLQQCLQSVFDAQQGIKMEVFVVDNNSVDGSVDMLQKSFPQVIIIANKENLGFSKANNQALRQARGEYVLLLNPDTVLQEDSLKKSLDFMDRRPDSGGLGIKMIDGSGNYLPESKRGLPSPWTALYKMIGLSKVFPKHPKFARYYLGHLSHNENQEIEVLSGAYMLMRKKALDQVGLLDEDFFMYGEDIDLSYRILKGGYKNLYLADSQIIHYKGESTKKGSLNYVRVFYLAMILYAQKHLNGQKERVFVSMIKLAVYLKALLALLGNFWRKTWPVLLEFVIIGITLSFALNLFEELQEKLIPKHISDPAPWIIASLSILSLLAINAYKTGSGFTKLLKAGIIFFLVFGFSYTLLPENLRFSRLFVLGSPLLIIPILGLTRFVLDRLKLAHYFHKTQHTILLVGKEENTKTISEKLRRMDDQAICLHWTPGNLQKQTESDNQLAELSRIHRADEIIFLNSDLKNERIFNLMALPYQREIHFKIIPRETDFVIGSGSKNARGQLSFLEPEPLFSTRAKRKKRWADLLFSFLMLPLFPVLLILTNPSGLLANWWSVLIGKKTWVGLNPEFLNSLIQPNLNRGVIYIAPSDLSEENILEINRNYCKNYSLNQELERISKEIKNLGKRHGT